MHRNLRKINVIPIEHGLNYLGFLLGKSVTASAPLVSSLTGVFGWGNRHHKVVSPIHLQYRPLDLWLVVEVKAQFLPALLKRQVSCPPARRVAIRECSCRLLRPSLRPQLHPPNRLACAEQLHCPLRLLPSMLTVLITNPVPLVIEQLLNGFTTAEEDSEVHLY